MFPGSRLRRGWNVLAAEVHQEHPLSTDTSFDLEFGIMRPSVSVPAVDDCPPPHTLPLRLRVKVRMLILPYLQHATPTSVTVRWMTDMFAAGWLSYGTTPAADEVWLNNTMCNGLGPNYQVELLGLTPSTKYYYRVYHDPSYNAVHPLAWPDALQHPFHFVTPPQLHVAKPFRVWALGDCGTGDGNQVAVRDGFLTRMAQEDSKPVDFMLFLGDNAYQKGDLRALTDHLFAPYAQQLPFLPSYAAIGNHDMAYGQADKQSTYYFRLFNPPRNGEAGGHPSNTKAYYSFKWAHAHFMIVDSYDSSMIDMLEWVRADAAYARATSKWFIVVMHHPLYTRGFHDSDNTPVEVEQTLMREQVLPTLEANGVDLILSGHSHAYERSMFLWNHTGLTTEWDNTTMLLDDSLGDPRDGGPYIKPYPGVTPHSGFVHVVAGNAGQLDSTRRAWKFDHPVMRSFSNGKRGIRELGSLCLDVDVDTLDVRLVTTDGTVRDRFQIRKLRGDESASPVPAPSASPEPEEVAALASPSQVPLLPSPSDAPKFNAAGVPHDHKSHTRTPTAVPSWSPAVPPPVAGSDGWASVSASVKPSRKPSRSPKPTPTRSRTATVTATRSPQASPSATPTKSAQPGGDEQAADSTSAGEGGPTTVQTMPTEWASLRDMEYAESALQLAAAVAILLFLLAVLRRRTCRKATAQPAMVVGDAQPGAGLPAADVHGRLHHLRRQARVMEC